MSAPTFNPVRAVKRWPSVWILDNRELVRASIRVRSVTVLQGCTIEVVDWNPARIDGGDA